MNNTAKKQNFNGPVGVLVLAGGGSARLGHPKQLLSYRGTTLLQHSVQEALAAGVGPVIVVLGADAENVKKSLDHPPVKVVINHGWKEGMASSIRCGVQDFQKNYPGVEGLILMVCDQPFIRAALLTELITAHRETGKPVVACSYAGTFGPPVFFHHSLLEELLRLEGDIGARAVVQQHADAVAVIPFPDGAFDVDTNQDVERLKTNNQSG